VQYLPTAARAAVIVVAGIDIVDPPAWRALAAIDRVEVAIAAVTVACVVFFGVLEALVVAVGLSVVDTVRRSARPYDAVLGWVPRLEDYRNVALHSLRDDESRRASVPAARFRGGPVQGEPIHVLPRRRDHRWRGEWFVCARRRQPSTRRQQ
jgi:MFS superfamily sulfate permease-like transporter